MTIERELPSPERSENEYDAAHTYPPAPSDEGAQYNSGRTVEEWREILDQEYSDDYEGHVIQKNRDGSKTYLRAYRFVLGVSEQDYDLQHARQMVPLTVDAGLTLAIRPVRVANAGYRGSDLKPVDELWLVFDEEGGLTGLDSTQGGGTWHQRVEAELAAIDQPLTLSLGDMYSAESNPREPIADLYGLINEAPYADALRQVPQPDVPSQADNTTS